MRNPRYHESGSALVMALMLMVLMGLIGFAALDAVTRDRQVAGYLNRKKAAFYAAEAGVAEGLQTLTNNGTPSFTTTTLSDAASYPYGRPSYAPDPNVAEPIQDIGTGPFPGMTDNLAQDAAAQFEIQYWRLHVQGRAPGGSTARLEAVGGALVGN